jgi:ketosteroid isomerase-like protein
MTTATLRAHSTERNIAKDEADVWAVITGLHKAHYDKDTAAIVAPYAEDAAVFNLAPPLAHHGVDRKEKQAWLDSWATPVDLEARDFKITVSGDLAFCHGFLRLSGTKKGAEGQVNFWMRETLCLERTANSWRIVHEHASVPFYMDGSLRPAFDLEP